MAVCVGCGLDVNAGSGLLEVQLHPGGDIVCDADGLAVVISPDACNGLSHHANGLYVPCPKGIADSSAVQTSPQGVGLPQAVVNGGNYGYLNDNATNSIHFCNTTCCTVHGVVTVNVADVYIVGHPGFIGNARLQVNINNAGMQDIEPSTRQTLAADSGNAQNTYLDINQHADLFLSLAAGACVDYQFNLQFAINTAAGSTIQTDSTGPKFVARWVLVETDCC